MTLRKELVIIPAQVKVIDHVTYTYSCRNCDPPNAFLLEKIRVYGIIRWRYYRKQGEDNKSEEFDKKCHINNLIYDDYSIQYAI